MADTKETTVLVNPDLATTTAALDPDVLPAAHPFRTVVLCFDGTGDQFDGDISNVCQLFSMLKKNDPEKQMVYYQPGIGTYTSYGITPAASATSKTLDMMFAWGLGQHTMKGYEFLMQNYRVGDRICIFGFSRGAYTARSLAGMIHKVGLLPHGNFEQVPFAYKMYAHNDVDQAANFKACFSIDVDIEFVGVWDTVSSVGIIPKRLPFTASNTIIKTFRHAVALDEHRAKFKANLWHRSAANDNNNGTAYPEDDRSHTHRSIGPGSVQRQGSTSETDPAHKGFNTAQDKKDMTDWERRYAKVRSKPTDVEEVWFAGAHCDVGGGSVKNGTRHALARIPLRWMIRECFKTNSGIMFSIRGLEQLGLDPESLYDSAIGAYPKVGRPPHPYLTLTAAQRPPQMIRPRASDLEPQATLEITAEEDEELNDALSPAYDQLELKPFSWWLLEVLPLYSGRQSRKAEKVEINLARARKVPRGHIREGVKVHRSVQMRMAAHIQPEPRGWPMKWWPWEPQPVQYEPRVQLDWSKVIWVD